MSIASLMPRSLAGSLVMAAALSAWPAVGEPPSRTDRGAVLLLDVAGSAKEMGRQQVALMPGLAAAAARIPGPNGAAAGKPAQTGASAGGHNSLWTAENAGMAEALGLRPAVLAARRPIAPMPGHTTALVGPPGTARAGAVLARNIAQTDRGHRRRPLVVRYRPARRQAYLLVGWPLMATPALGLNASGVTVSLQPYAYRDAEASPGAPRAYRRAIAQAENAEEAAHLIAAAPRRPEPRLVTIADASGTLRALACLPRACRDLPIDGHRLALTDHTGEPGWAALERWNRPASRQRRATVRQSLAAFDGGFYGMPAAALLRSRAPKGHGNDPAAVAHAGVLASVIVAPKQRSLWIATSAPPLAPFGRMAGISLSPDDTPEPAFLPAAPSFDARRAGEAPALQHLRGAARALAEDAPALAETRLAGIKNGHLQPSRQAWLAALSLARRGDLSASRRRLAHLDAAAPPRLAMHAALLEAELARRQGALATFRAALARAGRQHARLSDASLPRAEAILRQLTRQKAVALTRFPLLAGVPVRPRAGLKGRD